MGDSNERKPGGLVDIVALVAGCATGAGLRYLTVQWWTVSPLQLLMVTVFGVLLGFVVVGAVLVLPVNGAVRAFLAGLAGTVASISGYIALGITAPPWLSAGFIVLTPVAVVLGLAAGATAALTYGPSRRTDSDVRS